MLQVLSLHSRLQATITLVMLALAVWGLINYLRGQPVTSNYTAGLAIGQLLLMAEALLGVILLFGGFVPSQAALHIIYGIVAVLCLPFIYLYVRMRDERVAGLFYAGACLFLAGGAIRAFETAQW